MTAANPNPNTNKAEPHTHQLVKNFIVSAGGQSWHQCQTKGCKAKFSVVPPNKPLEDL